MRIKQWFSVQAQQVSAVTPTMGELGGQSRRPNLSFSLRGFIDVLDMFLYEHNI